MFIYWKIGNHFAKAYFGKFHLPRAGKNLHKKKSERIITEIHAGISREIPETFRGAIAEKNC